MRERTLKFAAYSPDGSHIVTASAGIARIWDVPQGKEIMVERGYADWDVSSGMEIMVLRGHEDDVTCAVFSPDGSHIVTASADKTARIWDAASGKEITVLRGSEESLNSVALSPDVSRIVAASMDKTARVWDAHFATMSKKDLVVEACARRLRDLTKMSREEMRLAGYPDSTPEIDVCEGIE